MSCKVKLPYANKLFRRIDNYGKNIASGVTLERILFVSSSIVITVMVGFVRTRSLRLPTVLLPHLYSLLLHWVCPFCPHFYVYQRKCDAQ